MEGVILKALSGFYYVDGGDGGLTACRGRGRFRHQKRTPLVGDRVRFTPLEEGKLAFTYILVVSGLTDNATANKFRKADA